MNISVRFTPDLRLTSQAVRRLRRKPTYVLRCIGVLVMLAGLLDSAVGGPVAVAITGLVIGLVLVVEIDVVIWLRLRRYKEMIVQPVAMTLTDEGINRASPTTSANFTWDMVRRVIDEQDFWIFVVNPLQAVMLPNAILSPDQRSELAGFLAARRPGSQGGDGRPSGDPTVASWGSE